MTKFKSLADLKEYSKDMTMEKRTRVIVGMGTCGIAAGAREIMSFLIEETGANNLDIDIVKTGCIGMCEQEPLLDVELPGQDRITYVKVTSDLVKRIVSEHIINGRIVKDAALARLTRED